MHIYNNKTRTLCLIIYFSSGILIDFTQVKTPLGHIEKGENSWERRLYENLMNIQGYYSQKIIPAAIYKLACSIFE